MLRLSVLFGGASIISIASAHAATACMVTLQSCPAQSGYGAGTYSDNYNNAGSNLTVCLQRADQYKAWCATPQPVVAQFTGYTTPVPTSVAAGFVAPAASTMQFYVDPMNGSDSNAGTSIGAPLLTIAGAQAAVRTYKAGHANQNITVWLRGGYYFRPGNVPITSPVASFGSADSGSTTQLITWAAYPGETPVISGGALLTGWTAAAAGVVPNAPAGSVYKANAGAAQFRQLYIQQWNATHRALTPGQNTTGTTPALIKLTRARYPAAVPPSNPSNPDLCAAAPSDCVQDLTMQLYLQTSWVLGQSTGTGAFVLPSASIANPTSWAAGETAAQIDQTEAVLRKTSGLDRLRLSFAGMSSGVPAVAFRTATLAGEHVTQDDWEVCGSMGEVVSGLCKTSSGIQVPGEGSGYYNMVADYMVNGQVGSQNSPVYFENNIAFIAHPGDWFADSGYQSSTAGTVYLYPPTNINLGSSSVSVIAPQGSNPGNLENAMPGSTPGDNEALLTVGSVSPTGCGPNNIVSYVQFIGLTFAHSNWLEPSFNGYVDDFEPNHIAGWAFSTKDNSWEYQVRPAPAAVQLGCTSNVTFADNTFAQLGGSGISDYSANNQYQSLSQNLTVYGNAFYQIAAGGVELINGKGQNVTVASNLIAGVGQEYGGGGATVNAAQELQMVHNDLRYVSSDGLFVANQAYSTYTPNQSPTSWVIENNIVSYSALDSNDVGGIYIYGNNPDHVLPFSFVPASGFNPWVPGDPLAGTPKVLIAWNEVMGFSPPLWMPNSTPSSPQPSGYPAPRAVYLDKYSEGVTVGYNDLINNYSPFWLNCENPTDINADHNLNNVVYNIVNPGLPGGGYQGHCGLLANGSTASSVNNNPGIAVPYWTTAGLYPDVSSTWSYLVNTQYPVQ